MVGSLIPVLDYMNHDRTAIVELKVSGGKGRGGGVERLVLRNQRPIKAGDEAFMNYMLPIGISP